MNIFLFLNHPGLFIFNCPFSSCWSNFGYSANNPFKESGHRPPHTPGTKDSVCPAFMMTVLARENFLCFWVHAKFRYEFQESLNLYLSKPQHAAWLGEPRKKTTAPRGEGKRNSSLSAGKLNANEPLPSSWLGRSSCAELRNGGATYVPQLDKTLPESNQLRGPYVGARWRPG